MQPFTFCPAAQSSACPFFKWHLCQKSICKKRNDVLLLSLSVIDLLRSNSFETLKSIHFDVFGQHNLQVFLKKFSNTSLVTVNQCLTNCKMIPWSNFKKKVIDYAGALLSYRGCEYGFIQRYSPAYSKSVKIMNWYTLRGAPFR